MVTLAVPVFNMDHYLPRCMDSLLNQTNGDYEILLIDDGSSDGSGALCDAYASSYPERVRAIHKENGGLSSARNAGIDAAMGEFIVFPDPDDWAEPEYVEAFLSFQRRFDADLVCTGYFVDYRDCCTPAKQDQETVLMDGAAGQKGLLLPPRMDGFAWNKLYRVNVIREQGLRFRDDVGITEDLDFAYRYLAHCEKVCFAPSSRTYHYFQREGAATRSGFSLGKLDSLRTYERIIADREGSESELAKAARDELCTMAVNLLWQYENSACREPRARKLLLRHIRSNLIPYLMGNRYGFGRKMQALLAGISPKLYGHLKNAVKK